MRNAMLINEKDNVIVAIEPLSKGTKAVYQAVSYTHLCREERFGPDGRYLSPEGNGLTWPEAMVDMRMAATSSISGIPWWIF